MEARALPRARLETPLKRLVIDGQGRRQEWLARQLDPPVDPSTLWSWVHGISIPGEAHQLQLVELTGIEREVLFPAS